MLWLHVELLHHWSVWPTKIFHAEIERILLKFEQLDDGQKVTESFLKDTEDTGTLCLYSVVVVLVCVCQCALCLHGYVSVCRTVYWTLQ